MHAVFSHLARRGFEATAAFQQKDEYQYNMPTWGIVMLATTGLFFLIVSTAVEYTFGRLIPALLMIESPQALLYEPLDTIDPDAPINKNTDPELLIVKQQPITSSFRSTIKHLQAKAGFRARFRGITLFVAYSFALSAVSGIVGSIPFVPRGVAPVLGAVLLANLSLAWTHIVISDPSPKPWFRRLPEAKVWKKIAGPTAILAIAEQLTVVLPVLLGRLYGLDMDAKAAANMSAPEKSAMALKGFSMFILCIVLGFVIVLPANVMLTRVQASLLSDDQETIVSFDRSFGGKVIPEIVGGSGVIGILDAWKSFDWSSRVRLVKAYAKVFAMQFALSVFFVGVVVAELFIVIGKSDLKKIITDPKNGDETNAFM